jgi:hypothetical protein
VLNPKILTDIGMIAPVMNSLARHDYEIGARMGVCFVFTGQWSLPRTMSNGR